MPIHSLSQKISADSLVKTLETFFSSSEFVKKGPKYNEFLECTWYHSYVMLTGSSGAWKTTQVTTINDTPNSFDSAVKNGLLYDEDVYYTIAPRFITRKSRSSDNNTWFVENVYVESEEKFKKLIEDDIVWIRRERDLWSEKVLYGFLSNPAIRGHIARVRREIYECISWLERPHHVRSPQQWGIVVYSGNNDMARNFEKIPFCAKHKDEFVHIYVQAEDNTTRFIKRSADVANTDKKQLEKRASDNGFDVYEKSHIVITNASWKQDSVKKEFNELMYILAQHNEKLTHKN